jgi:hypothetical protein
MRSQRLRAGALVLALSAGPLLAAPARADAPPRLTFEAARVEADPALRTVDLKGRIRAAFGAYRLTAEQLQLRFHDARVTFDGEGQVALCPCPDPPITFRFRGGELSAPGDLRLRFPRVHLFGVPVFALPHLWLRSSDQLGLLPPVLAYRGADGLLVGEGLHLPLPSAREGARALDLHASAYLRGGAEIRATLTTPESRLRLVVDEMRGERVLLDAAGFKAASDRSGLDFAWDLDATRGDRARRGTVDLAPAALPFDSLAASMIARASLGSASALVSTGLLGRAARGEGAPAIGPVAYASLGGPLGRAGSWDASAEGLMLGDAADHRALPLGRAALRAGITGRGGPLRLHLEGGARASVAGARAIDRTIDHASDRPSLDAALGAGLSAELPLIRAFGGAPGEAPLVHAITPSLRVRGALGLERGSFFQHLTPLSSPGLALAQAGLSTALGRFAGSSLRLDLRGGALARPSLADALLEARLVTEASALSASAIAVAVLGRDTPSTALLAHLRLGPAQGRFPSLRVDLAGASGGDARSARLLTTWSSAVPGAEPPYFSASGWTLGAEASLPLSESVRASLGGVEDARRGKLLAIRAGASYRHPCGCLGLELRAGQRLDRRGVDVVLAVDLVPGARPLPSLLSR